MVGVTVKLCLYGARIAQARAKTALIGNERGEGAQAGGSTVAHADCQLIHFEASASPVNATTTLRPHLVYLAEVGKREK